MSGTVATIEVRPYGDADFNAVVELWAEVFVDDPSHNVSKEMIDRKLQVQPELFLVAVRDGAIVGTVMAGFDGVRGWIHRLAVKESVRRSGIGTKLMSAAEVGLARMGCPKVNLQIRAENTDVVAFYRSLGYGVEERVSMGKLVDPPVHIAPYDSEWPRRFEEERNALSKSIGTWLVGPIEHVGSTAVPGLAAKPIIDIMAPVRDLESSKPALEALAGLGYCYFPYRKDIMHWLCKPSNGFRTHHLHLVPLGSALWIDRLAFRDALRRDSALAAEYQDLKRELAERYRYDREAYTDAKGPFVERVLESRGREPPSRVRANR